MGFLILLSPRTLFYTCGFEIVAVSFAFKIGNSNLTVLKFLPNGEGNAAIQSGGGLPVAGVGEV